MCNLHFKISFIPHQKKAYHISVSISPGTHPSGDRLQEISLEMCKSGLSGSDQNLCWQLLRFNVTGYLILSINSKIHPFLYLFILPRNTKTTNELTKELARNQMAREDENHGIIIMWELPLNAVWENRMNTRL